MFHKSLDALKNILTSLKSRCKLKSMVCHSQKAAIFFHLVKHEEMMHFTAYDVKFDKVAYLT